MGGSQSHEFMVATDAGEDFVVSCPGTGYAANLEKAVSRPVAPCIPDPDGDLHPEKFHTPNRKTIAEVAEFTGLPETSQIKSLVMMVDERPILALVRGDHSLSETKFGDVTGGKDIRQAHPDEIRKHFGADAGSLGPVGVKNMRIIADLALQDRRNMIGGANENDYHLKNVTPGEDFKAEFFDIRQVAEGDTSLETGEPLVIHKSVEIGHIFKLGYKYSESMGLKVLNEAGEEVTVIMGSYGIGVERILCAAIELYADKDGMSMPASIAPFEVVITPVNYTDATQRQVADQLLSACTAAGLDAVLDDRDERPGVKFKDADLVGIPYRITIGKKLAQRIVEVVDRRTKQSADVPLAEAAEYVHRRVHGGA
jgi:prolyl-tRNA synthetase